MPGTATEKTFMRLKRSCIALVAAVSAYVAVFAGGEPPRECVGSKVEKQLDFRRMRQQLGMTETRWFGVALECYGDLHGAYPGPTSGMTSVAFLKSALIPTFREYFPLKDVWGNDFLYWSDTEH